MSKPAFAAYGDSANVFGGVSNPTGACAREARGAREARARRERSYRPEIRFARDPGPMGRDVVWVNSETDEMDDVRDAQVSSRTPATASRSCCRASTTRARNARSRTRSAISRITLTK